MRETDEQTEKKSRNYHLDYEESRVSLQVADEWVGMGDIRKYYFSRACALPGNGNFHQNTSVIIFFTLIIAITH